LGDPTSETDCSPRSCTTSLACTTFIPAEHHDASTAALSSRCSNGNGNSNGTRPSMPLSYASLKLVISLYLRCLSLVMTCLSCNHFNYITPILCPWRHRLAITSVLSTVQQQHALPVTRTRSIPAHDPHSPESGYWLGVKCVNAPPFHSNPPRRAWSLPSFTKPSSMWASHQLREP
jgi:hypothetical protein